MTRNVASVELTGQNDTVYVEKLVSFAIFPPPFSDDFIIVYAAALPLSAAGPPSGPHPPSPPPL